MAGERWYQWHYCAWSAIDGATASATSLLSCAHVSVPLLSVNCLTLNALPLPRRCPAVVDLVSASPKPALLACQREFAEQDKMTKVSRSRAAAKGKAGQEAAHVWDTLQQQRGASGRYACPPQGVWVPLVQSHQPYQQGVVLADLMQASNILGRHRSGSGSAAGQAQLAGCPPP